MSVVAFRNARARTDDAIAAEIIDGLGGGAQIQMRLLARHVAIPERRARLERIVDAIAARQGFTLRLSEPGGD